MIQDETDSGYILASATISMIVIGALAAGLVMIAIGELRRVRAEEDWVQLRSLYESVAVLSAAELTREPEARNFRFDDAQQSFSIEGVNFEAWLEWESEKLDLNAASLGLIESRAAESASSILPVSDLVNQLTAMRSANQPLRLIGDLSFDDTRVTECLRSMFTVFGGRRRLGEAVELEGVFDRPTPGTRLRLMISEHDDHRMADIVLLMTGDRYDPARIMDWRWVRQDQINACHE